MKTLAHEMVHILDSDRLGMGRFALGYLFPQILAVGVLSFPLLGWWALLFLLFLLPWPAPFRADYEARAYAIDMLSASYSYKEIQMERICELFTEWDYYRMATNKDWVKSRVLYWMKKAESGEEPNLTKVLLIYEMVLED